MKNTALERAYDPKDIEKTWYDFWHRKGYFRPEFRAKGPAYTVTIPPPNVTGELHMGHALQHAISRRGDFGTSGCGDFARCVCPAQITRVLARR